LQNGLIDRVNLVAAFQARTRDKTRPLAEQERASAASSHSFTNPAMLRSHPDSWLLLEREDLRSLIKNLEAADRPAAPQPKR
jgi:hypothetical protein